MSISLVALHLGMTTLSPSPRIPRRKDCVLYRDGYGYEKSNEDGRVDMLNKEHFKALKGSPRKS